MPSNLGGIEVGSFRVISTLRSRRDPFWISTRTSGWGCLWDQQIMSSLRMRRPAVQARKRKAETLPPRPGSTMQVEHEYERKGALAYLAAWDVHRAKVFGRCERKTGIRPFERLVEQVMSQEPYRSARRVFWIMDNGSSHRGERSNARLTERWPSIIPVHTPVHASWLNQVEIYFSILQRKVLSPADFEFAGRA